MAELWIALGRGNGTSALAGYENVQAALTGDRVIRHRFSRAFLNHPDVEAKNVYLLDVGGNLLANAADLDWLLDELPRIAPPRKAAWAMAIRRMTHNTTLAASCWEKLLQRIDEVPELAALYEWLRAWALDEECAVKAKAIWEQEKEWRRKVEEHKQLNKPYDYRPDIVKALTEMASGKAEAWFHLWCFLRNELQEPWKRFVPAICGFTRPGRSLSEDEKAVCRAGAKPRISPHTCGAKRENTTRTLMLHSQVGARFLVAHGFCGDGRAIAARTRWALVQGIDYRTPIRERREMREQQCALLHRVNPDVCASPR